MKKREDVMNKPIEKEKKRRRRMNRKRFWRNNLRF